MAAFHFPSLYYASSSLKSDSIVKMRRTAPFLPLWIILDVAVILFSVVVLLSPDNYYGPSSSLYFTSSVLTLLLIAGINAWILTFDREGIIYETVDEI